MDQRWLLSVVNYQSVWEVNWRNYIPADYFLPFSSWCIFYLKISLLIWIYKLILMGHYCWTRNLSRGRTIERKMNVCNSASFPLVAGELRPLLMFPGPSLSSHLYWLVLKCFADNSVEPEDVQPEMCQLEIQAIAASIFVPLIVHTGFNFLFHISQCFLRYFLFCLDYIDHLPFRNVSLEKESHPGRCLQANLPILLRLDNRKLSFIN